MANESEYSPETIAAFQKIFDDTVSSGKKIGLPEKFLLDLVNDKNDWSLVIKAHALMEAMINYLLSERLFISGHIGEKKKEISEFIERLPMNGRNGKVRFAFTLNLINETMRKFIDALSEIRNFYAHDIRSVDIKLEEYIKQFDEGKRQSFYKAISPWYPDDDKEAKSMREQFLKLNLILGLCMNFNLMETFSKPPSSLLGLLSAENAGK